MYPLLTHIPMKLKELDNRISETDWESTPDSVKTVMLELAGKVGQLNDQIGVLSAQIEPLAEQMSQIEAALPKRKRMKLTSGRGFR